MAILLPLIIVCSGVFLVLQTAGVKLTTVPLLKLLNQYENVYLDFKYRLKPITPPQTPLVIVGFDEQTIEHIGQWPPHRALVARMIKNIFKDAPTVVGVDVVYSEEERQFYALTEIDAALKDSSLSSQARQDVHLTLKRKASDLSGDSALADTFEKYADKLVLGCHWYGTDVVSNLEYRQMVQRKEAMTFSQFDRVSGLNYSELIHPLWPTYKQLNQNIHLFTQVIEHFGFFNAISETDGVFRRGMLVAAFVNPDGTHTFFPSLPLKMAQLSHPENPSLMLDISALGSGIYGIESLQWGSSHLTLLRDGTKFLNFLGPSHSFPHVSAHELMEGSDVLHVSQRNPHTGKVDKRDVPRVDFFKNKVVLIGATAAGIYDLRPTPTDRNYPGVELHATVYDNLMNNSFLSRRPDLGLLLTLTWFVLWITFSLLLLHLPAFAGALFTVALMAGLVWLDYSHLFIKHHLLLVMAWPLTVMGVLYTCVAVLLYFFEGREKKFIRGAFNKYVSGAVVEEMVTHREKLILGGEKREVSILFSDIRGFTTLSEQIETAELSRFLSDYLTPMTHLVLKHMGTLDKYIGDAVMAFWGAPVSTLHHSDKAIQCAIDMHLELKLLQEEWKHNKHYPAFEIGIGINTGIVAVGNMGSETIFDYTVIGDPVNLASRLEGLNKSYGSKLIVSEFTARRCDMSQVLHRRLDKVAVKGKKEGVVLYQVFGREGELFQGQKSVLQTIIPLYEKAWDAYATQQWQKAREGFGAVLTAYPDDKASQVILSRIESYVSDPSLLSKEWDGTFIATTK